jgi:hypothetical protein
VIRSIPCLAMPSMLFDGSPPGPGDAGIVEQDDFTIMGEIVGDLRIPIVHVADEAPASCPYRKSNPNVLVMQPAEMWLCEDPSDALHFARNRRVLVQRQMRAGFVVICHVR